MFEMTNSTKVRTTNAWGFAGWVGTRDTYTYRDIVLNVRKGTWYGRHTNSDFSEIDGSIAGTPFHTDADAKALESAPALVFLKRSERNYPRLEVAGSPADNRYRKDGYLPVFTGTLTEFANFKP